MTVIAAMYFIFPTRASKIITFFRPAITFIVHERIPRCLILYSFFQTYSRFISFPIHPMVCHTDLYKALNRQPDNISELLRIYNGDDVMIVLYQLPRQRYMVVAIGLCNSINARYPNTDMLSNSKLTNLCASLKTFLASLMQFSYSSCLLSLVQVCASQLLRVVFVCLQIDLQFLLQSPKCEEFYPSRLFCS